MAVRKKTTLLVVHCTATSPRGNLTSEKLRKMHRDRGFSDIGYNEWISRDGTIQGGRGVNAVGAHVRGYNSISYGISLEGGRDKKDYTKAQMVALERRLRALVSLYPHAKICGHRDLSPDADGDGVVEPHEHIKACPRFDVIPWARSKGLPAADIKGVWDKHGKDGPDARIVWLQRLLINLGYKPGPADGRHGIKTSKAIIAFQTDAVLPVNGEFDRETVARLRELNGVPETVLKKGKVPPPPDVEVVTENPHVTALVESADTSGRVSTTNIAAGVGSAGSALAIGNQILDVADQAKGFGDAALAAGPWVLLLIVCLAAGWWIWKERKAKAALALRARRLGL